MSKVAFFVEGFTEVLFLDKLLTEICDARNVSIEHREIRGGGQSGKVKRRFSTLSIKKATDQESLFVLIVDCGKDTHVGQYIKDEHESLTKAGYKKIIGLRDVRPTCTADQIPQLLQGLKKYLKTSLAPVDFILSQMEIEAWFLSEHSHFEKIDPKISVNLIKSNLGFDPSVDDMTIRLEPKKDLEDCYSLGGQQYIKSNPKTVNSLDYAFIYIQLKDKIPFLKQMIESIDSVLP